MTEYSQPPHDARKSRALTHPTRGAILELLGREPGLAPDSIAAKLGLKVANVCYHVGVLSSCGAVELVADKRRRGERLVRLPRTAAERKKSWLDVSGSMRDDVSEEQLKNLIEIASDFPPGYVQGS